MLESALTLISAPAGFGKTTLLSDWGRTVSADVAVAWITLDEEDTISTRFWTYVIAALQTLVPACGEEALALLRLPQSPPVESILVALINSLTTLSRTLVLILDDYHVITNISIHDEFTFFLGHLPPHVRVMLASREDPVLPLHRLRAQQQLTELRAHDLRFTLEEVTTFFHQTMHLDLTSEDIAMLESKTEGWIVGLQLAALSLKEQKHSGEFIALFTGNHRFILDYLAKEVFSRQPEEVQEFLLHTSILDRLSAPLCNALTGRCDGQVMLERLEQANLFLIPLDYERAWYRYHALFAEFLRERLNHTYPVQAPTLHERASAWCEGKGLISGAIMHALSAGHFTRAADLIESSASAMWSWSETNILTPFLEALPPEIVRSRPQLCIYRAWVLYLTSYLSEAERWLQNAERQLDMLEHEKGAGISPLQANHLPGEVWAIRSLMAAARYDLARTLDYFQRTSQLLATTSALYGQIKFTMGWVLSSLGDDEAACHCLEEGILASKEVGNDLYTARSYVSLACLQMSCGHMRGAEATCQQALRYGSASQTGQTLLMGAACFSLFELHYEWNNLEEAQYYLERAIDYAKRSGDALLERTACLMLPNLIFAQGQREQALQLFEEEFQCIQKAPLSRVLMVARESRVRFWLEAGDTASIARWERTYALDVEDDRDPLYAIERMTLARAYLAQGKAGEALGMVEGLVEKAKCTGRLYTLLNGMALVALALQAQRATQQAINTLAEALTLSEPEGMIRVFADFGGPMAELLLLLLERQRSGNHAIERKPSQEYLLKLLSALHIKTVTLARPQSAPVSMREKEILCLIADGFSTREVARSLVISEGTVKTHMKRIYAKLEVRSRTQAISRARMLGVL